MKPLLPNESCRNQFRAGLVSVTFRRLSAECIVQAVAEAGLHAIEWGGDVHAPHGDERRARQIGGWSRDLGLDVAYGSYYRVGESEANGLAFEAVLSSAIALGAKTIRVWAGNRAPESVDLVYWDRVINDARRIAAMAAPNDVTIAFERHSNTLTATPEAHRLLLESLSSPNIATFWQPDFTATVEDNRASLHSVLPRLRSVHVFHFDAPARQFLPLEPSQDWWLSFLPILRSSHRSHDLMIEFVADESLDAFRRDAAVLLRWMQLHERSASPISLTP